MGIITGKIFEPIGLGTPVVLIAPKGSDAVSLIEKDRLGWSFSGSQIEKLAACFADVLRAPRRPHNGAKNFEWPTIATRVDSILPKRLAAMIC